MTSKQENPFKSENQQEDDEEDLKGVQQPSGKPNKSGVKKNQDGESYWPISKNKRVTISEFKGKNYVNIRQYYEKDGQILPTKKGISLAQDQWEQFKKYFQQIDEKFNEVSGTKGKKKVKK